MRVSMLPADCLRSPYGGEQSRGVGVGGGEEGNKMTAAT